MGIIDFISFDFDRTWWRLFQKCVLRTELNINVFIINKHVIAYSVPIDVHLFPVYAAYNSLIYINWYVVIKPFIFTNSEKLNIQLNS